MSDVTLTRSRIRPGKTERVREWMAEIRTRQDEAIETLQHEGMIAEAAFLEQTGDGDYLVYYMEAEDLDAMYEAFESSPYEIDREHREVLREVLVEEESDLEPELLYHLTNPEYRAEEG